MFEAGGRAVGLSGTDWLPRFPDTDMKAALEREGEQISMTGRNEIMVEVDPEAAAAPPQ